MADRTEAVLATSGTTTMCSRDSSPAEEIEDEEECLLSSPVIVVPLTPSSDSMLVLSKFSSLTSDECCEMLSMSPEIRLGYFSLECSLGDKVFLLETCDGDEAAEELAEVLERPGGTKEGG